ncbi:hypothetical protein FRC03_001326 [Tulasnella sp. 419]|nr:hypothetical protein FRC03_001326 [Tulasnella sp. 419]
MPVTHLYDGAQRSNGRKKHTAPINPIEKQRRKQEKWERDHKFNHLIDNLLTHIDDEVQKIHKETNSSISFIRSALGIAGSELKGTRSENAHNAWVRGRMKEINDENEQKGEEHMSLPDFKEQYGHEYAQLTPAEREAYCTALTEHRKLQHPTKHKTYKAASIDIDYTVNQVNDIVSIRFSTIYIQELTLTLYVSFVVWRCEQDISPSSLVTEAIPTPSPSRHFIFPRN